MPTATTISMRITSSPITVTAASCARLGFPMPSSCPTLVLAAPTHQAAIALTAGTALLSNCYHRQHDNDLKLYHSHSCQLLPLGLPLPSPCPALVLAVPAHQTAMVLVTMPNNLCCFCIARCHLHHYTLNEMLTYTICMMHSGQSFGCHGLPLPWLSHGLRLSCILSQRSCTNNSIQTLTLLHTWSLWHLGP